MVKTHPHPRKASRQSANAGAASTRNPITPVVTLASQRWRQHWLLLALICIGMIASIVIACSVPLLSQTMLTGSVRNVLRATPTSSEISIHAQVGGLSTPSVQQISEVVDQPFAQYLRPYLKGHARYDIQTPRFNIFSPKPPASSDQISFYGSDPQADAAHVKLLQGRLPRSNSSVVEIAVDPNTAQLLNLHVGTQFVLNWTYYNLPAGFSVASGTPPTPVYMHFVTRVVGIFSVQNSDPFWHGQNFLPETTFSGFTTYYTALVSEQAFLAALDKLAVAENASQVFFFNPSFIYWYYNLDPSRISVSQLGNLVQQLTATQNYFTTNFSDPSQARNPPYIQQFTVSGDVLPVGGVPSILDKFHTQLAVAQIPAAILAIGILALLLFFISIMAGLLVERQSDGIVLLRSRGASRSQILGAFMTQSVVLGIIALVIGTPLAVFAGYLLAQRLLPPNAQDAINTITNAPMQALLSVKWYALAAVLIGVVTMFLALYRASRADVWATGRTHTASTQRPLWQRLNLDFFALVIAIAGYAISSYLTGIEQLLDPQTQQLVVTPLALLAPVFLLLAIVLLFLRFFPYLLHLFSVLVMRRQGAAPMLAVAQMARAPRQSLRMILLLSLATAFAIFALVFSATQAQRAQDIAAYQAGADFSGDIPTNAVNHYALAQETALYRGIPGVTSASVGYIEDDASSATNIAAFPIELRAVDPATYAQSSLWTAQDSAQPIAPLLAQLAAQRGSAIQNELIPAIVDSSTWDTLNLHIGSTFTLYKSTTPGNFVRYVVLAEVQHVPGLNSSDNGGIIVDYQSFLAIEAHKGYAAIIDNHVWLNTSGSPAALSRVRAELNTPALQLDNLYDRRALAASLQQDPLALNILGLLALGATAALLLALIGDLLASWLSVRQRLTNFTVLRALGADRRQIASVLAWEQAIVYVVTLLLGILFGALLALTIVPALIFTSLPIGQAANYITTDAFFAVQRIIPINIIVSPTLLIGFAVLVITCFGALSMMIRIVLHSSMTQVLRLDENQSSAFFAREDTFLARTLPHQVASGTGRRASRSLRPSIVTLALWQLREARFLLLMEGIGIIAAVVIVCMVPLFSTVAATTGLHDTLNASPSTAEITLDTTTQGISTAVFNGVRRQINPVMQQSLGQYLSQATPYLLNSTGYMLTPSSPATAKDQVQLVSTSLDQAAPHIRLLQGQLPQAAFSNGQIDALLSPATAQALHVTVGSLLHLRCDFFTNPQDMFGGNNPSGTLTLRVAGLFAVAGNASFWHDRDFQPVTNDNGTTFPIFVPDSAFLAAADQLASAAHAQTVFSPETFDLAWYYHLNPAAITSAQVSDLITRLNQLQTTVANKYGNLQSLISLGNAPPPPYLVQVNLYNPVQGEYALPTTLDSYRNRSTALSIPVAVLTLQIFALIVFFISLIANLLVDRQAEAVAITRSRGASSGQIFGALLAQSVVLGIVALIAGPLLAVFVVSTAARSLLGSGSQGAPALLVGQPLQSALSVGWYAAVTVLVVIIIMAALLWRASGTSVVSIRRQSARTTQRPLWQRLNLDVVAAIVAIVGYGISIYLASIGNLLDARTKVLVAAPLTLIAPLFLLLAALILFLRFFTTILQFAAKLTVRRKGATSMLALAQMSRAPRQSVRMTMLLALAVAFAIFTLVFSASQSQHIASLASYESGADFSGDLVVTPLHPSVQRETALYRAIPGVTSATVGFTSSGTASGTTLIIPMQVLAVDAQNFAQTAIWSSQDSSQSLSSLMNALLHDRANAVKADVVPAVIDMLTAQRLNLHNGNFFSMSIDGLPDNTLSCVVIAIVQHIPNVNDSNAPGTASYIPPGGVLVDYSTYAAVYKTDALVNGNGSSTALPINHVWLRSGSSPAAVASVRAALASTRLQLTNLYDRRALIDSMLSDPLYLSLVIILTIGAVTALLLTLVGNLLASWLNVRIRLTNFAVLRALGASPVQVTGVLIWEQVVIYATALLLGVVFGAIISFTAISTLAFTSVPATGVLSSISSDEFYALQYVLPAQIVLPLSLVLAFVALVVVCILALGTMAVVVLRPSMSQTLRLNED
jgi:ABC-type antimicrobial peptide transport system permease subunit